MTLWPHAADHDAWRDPAAADKLVWSSGLGGDALAAVAEKAGQEAADRGYPRWGRLALLGAATTGTGEEEEGEQGDRDERHADSHSLSASGAMVADRMAGGGVVLGSDGLWEELDSPA